MRIGFAGLNRIVVAALASEIGHAMVENRVSPTGVTVALRAITRRHYMVRGFVVMTILTAIDNGAVIEGCRRPVRIAVTVAAIG